MKKIKYFRFGIPIIIFVTLLVAVIGLSSKRADITTQSGWVLQTDLQSKLNGRVINDMTFLDSLTGFAVSSNKSPGDSGYIFKTTNGGGNWFVSFMPLKNFSKIKFINDSIGFASGGSGGGTAYICKTTNRGENWIGNTHGATSFIGMHILNKDTIYICDDNSLVGGLYRSVNGGNNWQLIYSAGIYNPQDIFMCNARVGFYKQNGLYKTTNGGYNWSKINDTSLYCFYFLDSLSGYRSISSDGIFQKSNNGGINWSNRLIPKIPGVSTLTSARYFTVYAKETIWAVGGAVWYPNPDRERGLIFKTTNGGLNWGYQLPDTHNITITKYRFINNIGPNNIWAYTDSGKGIHTTIGGDSTFYVGINNNFSNIPEEFILHQNYPNPFNPNTSIKYKVESTKQIKLIVFDILGKEVATLVNEKQKPGEYEVSFDGRNLPSGIYFYILSVEGMRIDTKKMILLK